MPFSIAKTFTVESGHLLTKHPGACKFPHGHSRTVEVVLTADTLDDRAMVCDFKALKRIIDFAVARYDHSLALKTADPQFASPPGTTLVQSSLRFLEEKVSMKGISGFDDVTDRSTRIRHPEEAGGDIAIVNPTIDLLQLRYRHRATGHTDGSSGSLGKVGPGIDVVPIIIPAEWRLSHPLGTVKIGGHDRWHKVRPAVRRKIPGLLRIVQKRLGKHPAIIRIGRSPRPQIDPRECHIRHRRQQSDDGDHDHDFDKGKATIL